MTGGDIELVGVRPEARGEEAAFFDFCQSGRLMLQRCLGCSRTIFYPRSVCPTCLSREIEWVEADGRGTVFTYTVQHREPPGFQGEAPYINAVIELAEGVRMFSRVIADPDDVSIGLPVQVAFATIDGTFRVPVFVPAAAGAP
jgi:uncharacterized OB-fold protein